MVSRHLFTTLNGFQLINVIGKSKYEMMMVCSSDKVNSLTFILQNRTEENRAILSTESFALVLLLVLLLLLILDIGIGLTCNVFLF